MVSLRWLSLSAVPSLFQITVLGGRDLSPGIIGCPCQASVNVRNENLGTKYR